MAYSKYEWSDGEIISASDMNRIEEGIQDNADTLGEIAELTEGAYVVGGANGLESSGYRIEVGSTTITPTAGDTVDADITFDEAFSSIPYVFVSPSSASPTLVEATANGRSTTGFTISFYRSTSTKTTIMWLAIGKA